MKLYWERKLAGLCVDCAAGLTDEDTGIRCLECRAEEVRRGTKYKATANGRAKYNAAAKRRYDARVAAGKCVVCCKPAGKLRLCPNCNQRKKEQYVDLAARREAA